MTDNAYRHNLDRILKHTGAEAVIKDKEMLTPGDILYPEGTVEALRARVFALESENAVLRDALTAARPYIRTEVWVGGTENGFMRKHSTDSAIVIIAKKIDTALSVSPALKKGNDGG